MAVRNRHHAIASHLLAAGALPNLSMQNLRYVNNSSFVRLSSNSLVNPDPDPLFLMPEVKVHILCLFLLLLLLQECCKLYKYFKNESDFRAIVLFIPILSS